MSTVNHVWYASYGSNLFKERFMCYIRGGKPEGSNTTYDGCRDTTPPVSEAPVILNHDLYFAKRSDSWQRGGVGFITVESSPSLRTLGYMYLITKEQFCDVIKQEIKSDSDININFDAVIQDGNMVFKEDSWYGNLIYVGQKDNRPIFTFTHAVNIAPKQRPSPAYLSMIISGLVQTHHLTQQEIAEYLSGKQGITGNYTLDELNDIVAPIFNTRF